jgi:hypothetical protein
MNDIKLGKYQKEWLLKYNKIDLSEWRCEVLLNKKTHRQELEWYYVGNWTPTKIEPYPSKLDGGYGYPSKLDGGYGLREKNIQSDPYFYWPKSP